MRTITTIVELHSILAAARARGASIGFVPTMGSLHAGHASLMAAARSGTDVVVTSIFVNPLQFGTGEDLATYPRDVVRDTALADEVGVDLLFVPAAAEMYPQPVLTRVSVDEISGRFEGASRPTHFAGVATVVAKLFSIVGECRAYFGEKDWQQVAVVRRLVSDLSLSVEVVACPTVREPDGLALSSRNVYLTSEERKAAPRLRLALEAGADLVTGGERDARTVEAHMARIVAFEPQLRLDYVAAVEASTLAVVDPLGGEIRLLIAARLGIPRLLDNIGVRIEG